MVKLAMQRNPERLSGFLLDDGHASTVHVPPSHTDHITDALPYAGTNEVHPVYFFTENGTRIDAADPDTSGNAYSYDWDDGNYYAVQVGTGNLWSILVAGTSVTITHPFTNDRAYAHAFAG